MKKFKAILVTDNEGEFELLKKEIPFEDLPDGEVLIRVNYSSINYKDGLALNGNKGKVIRKFPMVPGIDLAGVVEESSSIDFKEGDQVVATGSGLSETVWGGFSEFARLDSNKVIHIPKGIDLKRSMAIGTAGFTSMLCVLALEKNGINKEKNVIVTGAAGGVGSIAVAVLANLGYKVTASTGREENISFLKNLGAIDCISRENLMRDSKPLESATWGGAIDTVGGEIISTIIAQLDRNSSVASCGNAGGINLNSTVLPFILRGVNLLGIDSVNCEYNLRKEAWSRLERDLPLEKLDSLSNLISFEELLDESKKILNGSIRGRTIVKIN
ncbi:MAG: oxidoreductase [Rhodospirillaceae bacterium]|nr:oxidoreductase [Rhodospirillaceae bacterium]|tara:strand:- start:6025 stop:7011 length:987 start_codon:yes stop_codon:yes gene_type:complete